MNADQILVTHTSCMDELGKTELDALLEVSHEVQIPAGDLVLKAGSLVDNACIVLQGKVA